MWTQSVGVFTRYWSKYSNLRSDCQVSSWFTSSEITDSHIECMERNLRFYEEWLFFIPCLATISLSLQKEYFVLGNFTSDRLSACIINCCCKLSVTKHLHETTKLKTMVINPYELFYSTSKPFTTSIFTHHGTNRCKISYIYPLFYWSWTKWIGDRTRDHFMYESPDSLEGVLFSVNQTHAFVSFIPDCCLGDHHVNKTSMNCLVNYENESMGMNAIDECTIRKHPRIFFRAFLNCRAH